METTNSKRKKIIIITLVVAAAAVALMLVLMFSSGGKARELSKQLDLGKRYLDELDYDNALIAYNKAIDIDPKCEDAYIGAADSYIGLNKYPEAKEVVQKGIGILPESNVLKNKLAEIERLSEEATQTETSVRNSEDEEENFTGISEEVMAELEKIISLIQSGDDESAANELRTGTFATAMERLDELREKGKMIVETSKGKIGLYRINNAYYVYIGNYSGDGTRSGNAAWLSGTDSGAYIAKGQWTDDKPNGEMTIDSYRDMSKVQIDDGHTYAFHTNDKVTVVDGKYQGSCVMTWDMYNGEEDQHIWNISFSEGIAAADSQGMAANCTICGAGYYPGDHVHCIHGFE